MSLSVLLAKLVCQHKNIISMQSTYLFQADKYNSLYPSARDSKSKAAAAKITLKIELVVLSVLTFQT